MTLQGKKNHYNVKLLRGYGVSINLKNSKLVLKNGQDDITGKSETEEWFITNLPYEKIVISGKGYVSTEAISLLNQNNRNVVLVDTYGHPVSLMNGIMESLTATKYRMAQYDAFRDPEKCLYLQRWIVKEKLRSQIEFLKSTENELVKDGISKLEWYLGQVDVSEPVRIEAPSSHVYFNNFAKVIPSKFGFTSRNNSSIRTTKRNASDVINALLNYGYAVLAGEISKFVCGFGLDAYCGFYHRSHTGFQPLVYDMMEPFRWLVEYSVYKFANQHEGKRIRKKDYAYTREGKVVLEKIDHFLSESGKEGANLEENEWTIVDIGGKNSTVMFVNLLARLKVPYVVILDYDALMFCGSKIKTDTKEIITSSVPWYIHQTTGLTTNEIDDLDKLQNSIEKRVIKNENQSKEELWYSDDKLSFLSNMAKSRNIMVLIRDLEEALQNPVTRKDSKPLKALEKVNDLISKGSIPTEFKRVMHYIQERVISYK